MSFTPLKRFARIPSYAFAGACCCLALVLGGCATQSSSMLSPLPSPTPAPVSPAPVSLPLPITPTPPVPSPPLPPGPGVAFSVVSRAGLQTIAGATIQLYAPGMSGDGSTPTSVLNGTQVTDANGNAAIPAGYSCPAANSPLYLVSRGGVVGTSTSANANVVLMAALGPCNTVSSGATAIINEVTTVAAMYALAPFYSADGAIGARPTNLLGLTNAFLSAATLADVATGLSPGAILPGNAVSPASRVNSVANVLNACSTVAADCDLLYAATTTGTTRPGTTLDAAYNLVRNPGANVAALYGQSLTPGVFKPALTQPPSDWTMFISYGGGGMKSPEGIGVDSTGSVWVANYFGVASKFTTAGEPVFANGLVGSGLFSSYGMAIDLQDRVWITNEANPNKGMGSSISVFDASGASVAGSTGFVAGGLNYPHSIGIDPDGAVWVIDFGNSHLTVLDLAGNPLSGTNGLTTPKFAFPQVIALDGNHSAWVGNQSDGFVTKVSPDGISFTSYGCCDSPAGIAIDQENNVWVASYRGLYVSRILNTGEVANARYTGAGSMARPQGIAVDGSGNVWVANFGAPYLTELSGSLSAAPGTSLSPSTGYGADAKLLEAYALAIDASGNVWVSNAGSDSVTKFIGLASPVKTPLSGVPKGP